MYTLNSKIQPYTPELPLVWRILFIHLGTPAHKNEEISSSGLFLLKHLPGLAILLDLSGCTLLHLTQIGHSEAKPIPFLHRIHLAFIRFIKDIG